MTYLQKITSGIVTLDRPAFYKYVLIIVCIFAALCGFLIYRYYSVTGSLIKRMAKVNKDRTTVQHLLERFDQVTQQRAAVDALLNQEKDFKIASAFDKIIGSLGLERTKGTITIDQQELENYTEVTLRAQLQGLNTYNLVQLLNALDQNQRIYTKELIIDKQPGSSTINVSLVIATLLIRGQANEEAA